MSSQLAPDHVCSVHCNFCNTILSVNVPGNNLFNIVTVRCGHCANLLSVNMGALPQALPPQDFQNHQIASQDSRGECGSSSKCNRTSLMFPQEHDQQKMLPIRSPEKRQRVPSAYNRFIKVEIQRIKANNPDISHKEAFSAAAKNLQVEGVYVDEEQTLTDLDLLADMMDMREAVEEASDSQALKQIESQIQTKLETWSNSFNEAFKKRDFDNAIAATQ